MTEENCKHELAPGTCSLCAPPRERSVPRRARATKAPKSADDVIAPLAGDKDLSIPVFDSEPNVRADNDWMTATSGYPHDLRPNGWLYLRCNGALVARVRVPAMAWRDERPYRTGQDLSREWQGPGLVFAVDPATWEPFYQDLGADAESMRQGYRYHRTDKAGVVHHLRKGDPVTDGDWEE